MPRATRLLPEQHLRTQNDFQTVRQAGRRHQCDAFTAWWLQRERAPEAGPATNRSTPGKNDLGPRRLGVVASRAAVGNAVQRNRAKRRLRALFRLHQQTLPPGCDLLLVARRLLNQLPWATLEARFVVYASGLLRRSSPGGGRHDAAQNKPAERPRPNSPHERHESLL